MKKVLLAIALIAGCATAAGCDQAPPTDGSYQGSALDGHGDAVLAGVAGYAVGRVLGGASGSRNTHTTIVERHYYPASGYRPYRPAYRPSYRSSWSSSSYRSSGFRSSGFGRRR